MSMTLEQIQPYVDKDVLIHLKQEDGGIEEVEAKVRAATAAGVVIKRKGSSSVDLITPAEIYEIGDAPARRKAPVQRRLDPVGKDKVVQHLLDRHGVPLDWAKNADEDDALKYHNELDHANLGHRHEERKTDDKTEAEQKLES